MSGKPFFITLGMSSLLVLTCHAQTPPEGSTTSNGSPTVTSEQSSTQSNQQNSQAVTPSPSKESSKTGDVTTPLSPKLPISGPLPAQPPAPKPAPLEAFLGAMKPILATPSKVEGYVVESEIAPEVPAESKIGGFPVKQGPIALTAEQIKQFQALVLDEKSYFWGPAKKCLLQPKEVLRFIKGNEEVSVLFSTYCSMWSFVYQGRLKNQDYAQVEKGMSDFLTSAFPPPESSPPTQ